MSLITIGYLNYLKLKKRVRQGDPSSPSLFVLAIECLATALRQNQSYSGLLLREKRLKIFLFADDALLFSDGNEKQFDVVLKDLTAFGAVSGLVVKY